MYNGMIVVQLIDAAVQRALSFIDEAPMFELGGGETVSSEKFDCWCPALMHRLAKLCMYDCMLNLYYNVTDELRARMRFTPLCTQYYYYIFLMSNNAHAIYQPTTHIYKYTYQQHKW